MESEIKSSEIKQIDQWGPFFNPFTGQMNNMNASYDEDSAVAHMKATLGLLVYDTTRLISLIPNILMG